MPYAARVLSDEEKQKNAQNISGGAGANFATGVPGQEGEQKSSGQYTNIQSYLDANKDQAAQMGQNVTNKVDESASAAQSKIQSFGSVAPKVEAYDPNEAYQNLTSLSDQQKSQYKDVRSTGGYSGPQSIDQAGGYSDVQKSYDEAKARLENSKNETGQQQLLRDVYARPKYTGGENKLDQVLLQNNAGSKQALEGLSQKYAGLNDLFKSESDKVSAGIEQSKSQAALNRENVIKAEQDQWKGLIDPIQARADQMNIDNPALVNRISEDAQDNILNEETLQRLGLSKGTRLFNTQIGSYLQPNLANVGLNEAANSDERARFAALADLSGDQSRNQINADGQQVNPLGFDLGQFQTDLSNKQNAFNDLARSRTFQSQFKDEHGRLLNSGSTNLADFLAANSNFNPNQSALDWSYGDIKDEAPWYTGEDGGFGQAPVDSQFGDFNGGKLAPIGDGNQPAPIDPRTQMAGGYIKNDLYKQIQDFLNSQNYHRAIE